jgi:hypothetical protein
MGPLILHLTFTLERYGVHVFIGPVDSKFISAFISFMVHSAEADCESVFFADPP